MAKQSTKKTPKKSKAADTADPTEKQALQSPAETEASTASIASEPEKLAPQHLRLFALMVDYLVAVSLLKFWEQLTLGEHWDLDSPSMLGGGPATGWWVGLFLLLTLRDLTFGRSPGKWIVGISLGRADAPGQTPPAWARVLRNLFLVLLPLEAVLIFTDAYCRRLGDKAAGTVVVLPARQMAHFRRLLLVAMLFLSFLLASFLLTRWNLGRSAAYQAAESAVKRHPPIAEMVGAPYEIGSDPRVQWPTPDQTGGVEQARVRLQVEGPEGEADVEVLLELDRAAGTWVLRDISRVNHTLEKPEAQPKDAR